MDTSRSPWLLLLLALAVSRPADAGTEKDWALGTCNEAALAEGRSRAAASVRGAGKDSSDWLPLPFPARAEEIVGDALTVHRRAFSDIPVAELPEADRRLFELDDRGDLRTEVVRIADWTPNRCDPRVTRNGDWLARFFAAGSGEEITRVLVHDNGMIGRLRHATAKYSFPPLPALRLPGGLPFDLSEVDRTSGQYVTLWGPVECDALSPCLAWRSAGGALIVRGNEWYRVTADSERISFALDLQSGSKGATAERVQREGRQLLSLGGDLWAAADKGRIRSN